MHLVIHRISSLDVKLSPDHSQKQLPLEESITLAEGAPCIYSKLGTGRVWQMGPMLLQPSQAKVAC